MTPFIASTPTYVGIYMRAELNPASLGVAEASQVDDGEWFLNRVFIPEKLRGQGIGTALVAKLLEETTRQGCKKLVLTPGGYDTPYEQQEAFYLKCGFRLIQPGLMEYP